MIIRELGLIKSQSLQLLTSFANPKEIDLDLVKAYRARRFLDKVIGFELSPLL